MPYEGEFATYRSIRRIVENPKVQALLNRCRFLEIDRTQASTTPYAAPVAAAQLPELVLAIDGSYQEVDVKNGFPGAKVGYVTVASVLLDLHRITELDEYRPINPIEFRTTEHAETIDAAMPGTNITTIHETTARAAFRKQLYDVFYDVILDEVHHTRLLTTYEELLAHKPQTNPQSCPYKESNDCNIEFVVGPGISACPGCGGQIYSTDALRIHERFNDLGSNGEAFGLVMQVWERVLLVHYLRCFEKQNILDKVTKLAFFVDGPLAVFGPPAWLSAAISIELKRINTKVQQMTNKDLVIVGVEKTGNFVEHFSQIDQTEEPGVTRYGPRTYTLLVDAYIKSRITCSDSDRRYGKDTYFGRKMFYKSASGAMIVATIPFLNDAQDTLATDDPALYPQLPAIFTLLDKLASSRHLNAVTPLVAAHSYAAIPLNLGTRVLRSLALALMGER